MGRSDRVPGYGHRTERSVLKGDKERKSVAGNMPVVDENCKAVSFCYLFAATL